jgi:hypothetical protein
MSLEARAAGLLPVLLIISTQSANAQVLYGSITGNVSDDSGGVIARAAVTIANSGTNQSRNTLTNVAGGYAFPNVEPGAYTVSVTLPGFQTFRATGVRVSGNAVVRVDATLQVGAVSESVTVSAGAATLQTDRADVRYEVDGSTLNNMPVPVGRNYQNALRLLPGFSVSGGGAIRASNPAAAYNLNVNGVSAQVNNTRVDGATATNNFIQSLASYIPALEAIETVDAVTNSFDAETGLAGGASINVHIKSGTNEIHGSAFEYHTSNRLNARPVTLPARDGKPKFVYNQFGGTVGGPIRKDKLFYFLSYEGTTDYRSYQRFVTIPTAAARQGNLSESGLPVYDPATGNPDGSGRQPFPGNVIPAARQSGLSRKFTPLWPEPNQPGLASNYFVTAPSPYNRHTVDTKINWNPVSKLTMFGRLGLIFWDQYYPTVFGKELGGRTVSGQQSGTGSGETVSLTIAATYAITPAFVMDGYFGFNRSTQNAIPERLDENVGLDVFGIPGTNGPRRFEGGFPRILIAGYDGIGQDEPYMPWIRHDPAYNYVANFNWNKGRHNIRFGVDLARRHLNHAQPEIEGQLGGAAGGFQFSNGVTEVRGGPGANRANAFASFLLGLPQQMGRTLQVPDEFTLRSSFYSAYVRDQWDLTRKLSINYGVRWEYLPFPTRAGRGVEFYDTGTNKIHICGYGVVPSDCGVTVVKTAFSPRVGLAWRATNTFVVRAGYGITWDPFDVGPRGVRTNYPVLISMNLTGLTSFEPVALWDRGLPPVPVPDLGNGIIDVPAAAVIHTVAKRIDRGYIQSWNLTLQKQLPLGLVAQAGYVATRSIRQFGASNLNAGQEIGRGVAGQPLYQAFGRTAFSQEYRPLGTGLYDALQTTLERRFAAGLQLGVSYTWSKAIGVNGGSESTPRIQALSYFHLNRAVLDYDRTHVMHATGVWQLPFGRGKRWANGGLASAVAGGWQLNGVLNLMSGLPFSVSASGTSLNLPNSTQRGDQVLPEVRKLGGTGRGQSFFDPMAFRAVTQPRFGTAGFNSLRGPGLVNLDLGLFRDFRMTERLQLQFRAEAFNFTNTPHWSNPGANASGVTFHPDGSIRDLGGFGEITGTNASYLGRAGSDERVLRLGLRISF